MGAMTQAQLTFRAGLSRLFIGGAACIALPILYPRTRATLWVLGVYLVIASIEEVLIKKEIAVRWRPLVAGPVDMAIVTFFVHRLGGTATVWPALFFFPGLLHPPLL